MRRIPWWTLVSSAGAPVLLIGGWTVAAGLQPAGYDSIRDTISALAGHGATDRWVMTAGLAGLGVCHLVTSLGLRPAALPGRFALAIGGIATLFVSALPLPRVGTSHAHGLVALVAFVALAAWPALAIRRENHNTLGVRTGAAATTTLLVIVIWFGLSLWSGHLVGLSERCAAGAEALWPLLVVLSVMRRARPSSTPRSDAPARRSPRHR